MGFFFDPPVKEPGTGSMGFYLAPLPFPILIAVSKLIITFGIPFFFWWFQPRSKKLEDGNHFCRKFHMTVTFGLLVLITPGETNPELF